MRKLSKKKPYNYQNNYVTILSKYIFKLYDIYHTTQFYRIVLYYTKLKLKTFELSGLVERQFKEIIAISIIANI
jgi:hypothetical protein